MIQPVVLPRFLKVLSTSWDRYVCRLPFVKALCVTLSIWMLMPPDAVAQTTPPATEPLPASFLPQSPTVAHLPRFDAQQNVDLKSGAAQASVPLVEISSGPLKLPVSLAYSFSGLRVNQPVDLVGLGWSLQAGGSISRQVVGTLDDAAGNRGYNSDSVFAHSVNGNAATPNNWHLDFLRNAYKGDVDVAPDIYTFSVAGYTGRFVLRDTTVVLLPAQPVQIRVLSVNNQRVFQLATEAGVRYLFGAQEHTIPNSKNFGKISQYVSAWHLTRVVSANDADTIHLHYAPYPYSEQSRLAMTTGRQFVESRSNDPNGATSCAGGFTFQNVHSYGSRIDALVLTGISTRRSRVVFTRDAAHVLKRVQLLATAAGTSHEVRSFTLGQTVFAARQLAALAGNWLRLDRVQEGNGPVQLPPYTFAYDTTHLLPVRGSTGQDHWGYYNGEDNNGNGGTSSAFLPDALKGPLAASQLGNMAANRSPNVGFAMTGALLRMGYPTGGHTDFAYEGNRYAIDYNYIIHQGRELLAAYDPTPQVHLDAARLPSNRAVLATLSGDSMRFTLTAPTEVKFTLFRSGAQPDPYDRNYLADFLLVAPRPAADSIIEDRGIDFNGREVFLTLPAGTYVAWALCDRGETNVSVVVEFPQRVFRYDAPGPGVRVRQTTTSAAGAPSLIRRYEYTLTDANGTHSSGKTLLPILEDGTPGYPFHRVENQRVGGGIIDRCWYNDISSNYTEFGLEYSKQTFFYEQVLERTGPVGQDQGTTRSRFQLQPDNLNDVVLSEQAVYRQGATAPAQLAQRERYHYGVYEPGVHLSALQVWQVLSISLNGGGCFVRCEDYETQAFRLSTRFAAPDTTVLVRYGLRGDSVVTVTATEYRDQRPVRMAARSNGRWNITALKRLREYDPTLPGMTSLLRHNFNPVLETQTWQRALNGADSVLTGGQTTLYDPRWRAPASTWRLDLARPVTGANNELRTAAGRYAAWLSDTRYRLVAREGYDPATGDPVEQRRAHGPATAYVWGYAGTETVAVVENATAAQVAYAGFEAGELGRWQGDAAQLSTPGYTGQVGYVLTALGLQCDGLSSGTYRVTCWQPAGGAPLTANGVALQPTGPAVRGWTPLGASVAVGAAGTVTLAGTGRVDELRLCPADARMTTYTHIPLVGVASQTDPSGRTTTYEYDVLGRLVRTSDEQGRILSQQQYHFAQH
ncbi:RHS repeat domain-containing protein [Hymenobacter convexus]|uniref:RHS repeat domain-containing protein n=1 Tax=Hymenobacter sp. CA1UV-4 TaxID=3063782 RepID=UPI002712B672|nr:RHS repeat domain-containing protein [Hymenobacter sp. CA1UV-4]MDO7852969.1 RHS repeat domain-containing protein [Hymenobacter sp. CA1UV-4]